MTDHQFFYGSSFADDYLFRDAASLPRYGHLARKVMMHYLRDRYDPYMHGLAHEVFLRQMIREFVSYKVLHRLTAYDWEWLDHSFRKYFNGCFNLGLPYDESRIMAGIQGAAKAPATINFDTAH